MKWSPVEIIHYFPSARHYYHHQNQIERQSCDNIDFSMLKQEALVVTQQTKGKIEEGNPESGDTEAHLATTVSSKRLMGGCGHSRDDMTSPVWEFTMVRIQAEECLNRP